MPTRRAPIRLGLASAVILVLAFAVAAPAVLAATRGVDIRDFAFSPRTIEIRVGDTVRWTNRDSVAHTATARNGSFDTGLLADGESGSVRFTAAGTYRYVCTPHPDMTGTVVVRAPGTVVPPNTTTSTITDASDATAASTETGLGLLAAFGGVAFFLVERVLRRRRRLRD
jgi:plastocyanin